MKEEIKRVISPVIYIVSFYVVLLYTHGQYISMLLNFFSKVRYNDDITLSLRSTNNLVMLVFGIASYYWNYKTFKVPQKGSILRWVINWGIDLLIIPLSVLIMVLYNNRKVGTPNLSSIENMFLMWTLLGVKHVLFFFVDRNSKQPE